MGEPLMSYGLHHLHTHSTQAHPPEGRAGATHQATHHGRPGPLEAVGTSPVWGRVGVCGWCAFCTPSCTPRDTVEGGWVGEVNPTMYREGPPIYHRPGHSQDAVTVTSSNSLSLPVVYSSRRVVVLPPGCHSQAPGRWCTAHAELLLMYGFLGWPMTDTKARFLLVDKLLHHCVVYVCTRGMGPVPIAGHVAPPRCPGDVAGTVLAPLKAASQQAWLRWLRQFSVSEWGVPSWLGGFGVDGTTGERPSGVLRRSYRASASGRHV